MRYRIKLGAPRDRPLQTLRSGLARPVAKLLAAALLTACGETGADPVEHPPVPPLGLFISHDDGYLRPFAGLFISSADGFQVGDGGDMEPDSFLFHVFIANVSSTPISGIRVTDEIAPHSGIAVCREVPTLSPIGQNLEEVIPRMANPSVGIIFGANCSPDGFVWEIGTLDEGEDATLFFRAEATAEGGDVNRITLSAESVADLLVHEQPFLISETGNTPEFDVTIDDGIVDSLFGFDGSRDFFTVGDGSDARQDDLAYRIVVYNFGPADAHDLRIVTAGQGIACRAILDRDQTCGDCPDVGPNPTNGTVDGGTCSPSGFTWRIATLEGNIGGITAAVLYFRAEALEEGTAVNRVVLSGGGLSFPVVVEEPTTIFAD